MPIRHAIWTVDDKPKPLSLAGTTSEQRLEDMIVASPAILSDEWMLIGRQERTTGGGRIDLMAIEPDGSLVLIEIKRNRTPREVAAQALDYASWIETLGPDEIAAIYGRFSEGRSLAEEFRTRFGAPLTESELNQGHKIIIVATELDDSTERIIGYLNARDVPINVLFFQIFQNGGEQLLSRAWLIDPVETQSNAAAAPDNDSEPWNGEYYASFGHGMGRSWEEGRKYGFISAGGGAWYSNSLRLLKPGDRVWVKAPGHGFVGVGRVKGPRENAATFEITTEYGPRKAMEVLAGDHYHRQHTDNPEKAEYFVPIEWIKSIDIADAIDEIGLFGNQNTVCRPKTPKWRHTVEHLKQRFGVRD